MNRPRKPDPTDAVNEAVDQLRDELLGVIQAQPGKWVRAAEIDAALGQKVTQWSYDDLEYEGLIERRGSQGVWSYRSVPADN